MAMGAMDWETSHFLYLIKFTFMLMNSTNKNTLLL